MTKVNPAVSAVRLDGIDLLRGVAILLVLMNHIHMRLFLARIPYTEGLPGQLIRTLVWSGQRGVQIFFTISGFLITSTAIRRWGTLANIDVAGFYRLRFARIAPLLFALLLVLSGLHLAGVKHFVVGDQTGGLGRALAAALGLHVNVLEAQRGYLPASWDILWSLSVEEVFYLGFPLACAATARRLSVLVWLALVFVALGPLARIVLANGNPVWQEYSYLGGMDAIALGALTAMLSSRFQMPISALQAQTLAGVATLLISVGWSMRVSESAFGRAGLDMTIISLGTCLVMVPAAQTRWRSPALLEPLAGLGRHSYEIYLTHMFVIFAAFELFLTLPNKIAAVPGYFALSLLGSALLGAAVYRWYSEPMNLRLRRATAVRS